MKNKRNIIVKTIEWGLFAVILVLFVAILSPLLPTKKFFSSYAVVSGSMKPTIDTGSIAVIKPRSTETYNKGTIIAFSLANDPKTTILHRVVEKNVANGVATYKTKGDANNRNDTWTVNHDNVKGELSFSIPYAGYMVAGVQTPLGFILTLGTPALFLIILQIRSIKHGIEEEVQKRVKQKEGTPFQMYKFGIIFLLGALMSISTPHVYALLSSAATMTGISISTKETFAQITLTHQPVNHTATLTAENISGYTMLSYVLTYDTDTISEEVSGEKSITSDDNYSKVITLGTCSQDGCTYQDNPHNFHLSVTLKKPDNSEVTLEKDL